MQRWPLVVCAFATLFIAARLRGLPGQVPLAPPSEEPPPPEAPLIVPAGHCPVDLLPASLRQPLTDAESAELRELVAQWLIDTNAPSIVYPRGVLFVESEEDRGDDPPYPRSASAESARVCGTAATWLRSAARDRLASVDALQCDGNVCCYAGMEYSPTGLIVFHHHRTMWSLDAWAQTYNAGLAPDLAADNTRFVRDALARLAPTRCPGEPAASD
jgi:hypothetical protein